MFDFEIKIARTKEEKNKALRALHSAYQVPRFQKNSRKIISKNI